MPCAIQAERLALVLCGGREAPDAGLLARTRERVEAAGFRLLPTAVSDQTITPEYAGESAGLGPLGGILAAVESGADLNGSCLLVVPADMPNLNPRALNRLADITEADGRGAIFDLGPLPLALILTADLRRTLRQAAGDSGRRSLSDLVERLGLPIVASLPEDGLDNLVTRSGTRRAQAATGFEQPIAKRRPHDPTDVDRSPEPIFSAIPDHQGD